MFITCTQICNFPPNSINLLHVKRAHLQMTLWEGADQHSPPDMDISNLGWEIKAGVLSKCIYPGPTGPPALMDVISCRCRAAGKACAAICSYEKDAAIPTRDRSTWMVRTKRTVCRRSMKLWMLTILLIENECIKQRSFIRIRIRIRMFIYLTHIQYTLSQY